MDKQAIRQRAQALYEDELQYSIARDERIDLARCRSRAAVRIGREMEGRDISGVWLGYVEGIARAVERGFEIDLSNGQLRVEGCVRVGNLAAIPAGKMRAADWIEHDAMRENKLREHVEKREHERQQIRQIVGRLRKHGGNPTTLEACPDLFAAEVAA